MKKFIKYMLFTVIAITVVFVSSKIEQSSAEEMQFEGIISNAGGANVNSQANYSTFVTELAFGTRVNVIGKVNSLYKISYDSGKIGYVSTNLITNVSQNILTIDAPGVESYRSYCDSLINNGFVESYCPYLYYLHSKYPEWQFKADRVGVTLDEASKNEEMKCSLQTDNENFKIGWNEANYYFVHSKVIASYMDPRNGMFERSIFQFFDSDDNKDLSSDETLDYIVGNGNLKQYLDYFKTAAVNNGINVVDLVARSKNEGANTVGYDSVNGNYSTKYNIYYNGNSLDGYYNFFNIGSYGSNPIYNGLLYAAGWFDASNNSFQRPWNSPEKAISGGAEFLANSYIKKGQDTPYYRKFNVSSYAVYARYTNQYMTAVHAPLSEALDLYGTYKNSNSLNQAFKFTIPVYESMGDTPYQALNRSPDSTLNSISIDGNALVGFDKDITEYDRNINTDSNSISVTANPNNGGATIEGTGNYDFVDNVANVTIRVTSEDKSSVTEYKLIIRKISSGVNISVNDVLSKVDVRINNNIMYGISPGMNASTLINTIAKNGGIAVVRDVNGNVKGSGILATGDKIEVSGTSETVTFIISVRGDTSGDGQVKLNDFILIQSHILGKLTLENEKFYAGDVNFDNGIKLNDFILVQSHILGKLNL